MLNSEGKDITVWELGRAISRRINSLLTPQTILEIQVQMAESVGLWFAIIDYHVDTTLVGRHALCELKLNEDISRSHVNVAFQYAAKSGYMCHLPFAANEIVLFYDVYDRLPNSGTRYVTLSDEGEDGTVLIARTYTATASSRQYSHRLIRNY